MTAVGNDLKCNNYQCRAQLGMEAQAVVTTCSHVFCLDCASQQLGARVCPACEQALEDDDDIIVSWKMDTLICRSSRVKVCALNPSSKYKTTILAGMTPAVILEVASRALGFWTYQTSQEAAFQSMALKRTESRLEEAEQVTGGSAQRAIKDFENQLHNEKRRSHGFEQALKEKERELLKMKGMNDDMMKRAVLGNAAQNEMMRGDGRQASPHDAGRGQDRRRMMSGTPLATNFHTQQTFRPTPMASQNPPPQSRGINGGGGPFFYPKVSSTTSAYNSRPAPSPASFQLHNVQAGPSRSQGSVVRQRVARDINYGGQRGNGAEAVAGDQRRPRLQGRQAVGPAYFGAPL